MGKEPTGKKLSASASNDQLKLRDFIPAPKDQSCESCKFFALEPNDMAKTQGFCYRKPPQLITLPQMTPEGPRVLPVTMFPSVKTEAWCGEYGKKVVLSS